MEGHLTDKLKPQELAARAPFEQWMAWGNALADEAADIGRAMHFVASDRPVLGAGEAVASSPLTPRAGQWCSRLKVQARAAMALPLSPSHPDQLVGKSPDGQRVAKGNGHAWGKDAAGWDRCTQCWVGGMPGKEDKAPPHAKESLSWP